MRVRARLLGQVLRGRRLRGRLCRRLPGGSYSLVFCLLDTCYQGDPGDENDVAVFDSLNDCVPGNSEFNGHPPDQARQEFGARCCLDGP